MNNAGKNALMILLAASAAGLGCSGGGPVNIGNTQTLGAVLSDYAATWDGYLETANFWPDGSDHVRLAIDSTGQGTLRIGDLALIGPPTDPNVGYPPNAYSLTEGNTTGTGIPGALDEGVLYPLHSTAVQGNRIHAGLDPNDVYAAWCLLQTPRDWTDPSDGIPAYNCVPRPLTETYDPTTRACTMNLADGTTEPVDCLKWDICFMSMSCACTASGCVENAVPAGTPANQYQLQIDGTLDSSGSTLTGSLLGSTFVVTRQ
jgi:hypothetical protein